MNFHLPPARPPAHQRGHPLSFFSSLFVLERHRPPPVGSNFRLTSTGFTGDGLWRRWCFHRGGGGGNSAIISRDLGARPLFLSDHCSPAGNYKGLFRSKGKRRRRWWSNSSFGGLCCSKGGASFATSENTVHSTSMESKNFTKKLPKLLVAVPE